MHNLNVASAAGRREVAPGLDQPGWRRGVLRRLGVYIVLTALFTMVMVNFSSQHGRLAVGPTDDDCNYMVDALQRLHILFESPKQFVRNLIQLPPHSPFSTGLATFAFLIFGPHQWAPYVCNGLVLLALVLIVDYLTAPNGSEARI